MKLPERLVGFVNYGDTKYPFEFDKESFYLNLYPPTTEIWDETSSFREFSDLLRRTRRSTNG